MSRKSNVGKTVFVLIIIAACCAAFIMYRPQIMSFAEAKFGSKAAIQKTAASVGSGIDKANDTIEKGLKDAGKEAGKGIDKLRM